MHGTTLLLVICGLAAAEYHGATETLPETGDISILRRGDLQRYGTFVGAGQTNSRRNKRAISSVFREAWVRLLKTTLGFRVVQYSDGSKGKYFVKLGSVEDARADFYSLRPTRVIHKGSRTAGLAENQYVSLDVLPSGVAMLQLGRKNRRLITYVPSY